MRAVEAHAFLSADYECFVAVLLVDYGACLVGEFLVEVDDVGFGEVAGGFDGVDIDREAADGLAFSDGAEFVGDFVGSYDCHDEGFGGVVDGPGGVFGELEDEDGADLLVLGVCVGDEECEEEEG